MPSAVAQARCRSADLLSYIQISSTASSVGRTATSATHIGAECALPSSPGLPSDRWTAAALDLPHHACGLYAAEWQNLGTPRRPKLGCCPSVRARRRLAAALGRTSRELAGERSSPRLQSSGRRRRRRRWRRRRQPGGGRSPLGELAAREAKGGSRRPGPQQRPGGRAQQPRPAGEAVQRSLQRSLPRRVSARPVAGNGRCLPGGSRHGASSPKGALEPPRPAPIVCRYLNDEPFTPEFRAAAAAVSAAPSFFGIVPTEHWWVSRHGLRFVLPCCCCCCRRCRCRC